LNARNLLKQNNFDMADFRLNFRLFFPVLPVENLSLRTGVSRRRKMLLLARVRENRA